jgi:multimeric flavodoxin WrbA
MRIALLNGESDPASPFARLLDGIERRLLQQGHQVDRLDLAHMQLKGCLGCWSCWVKTPGQCARRDDSEQVCRALIAADLALWASPLRLGFTSALLKRAADQMIPLIHPFFHLDRGEVHHRPRYKKYPLFGLLLGPEPGGDAEDVQITSDLWARTARNLQTRLAFTILAAEATQPFIEETAHAIASVA